MGKLGFKRDGVDDPWVIEISGSSAIVYILEDGGGGGKWNDGTSQDIAGPAGVYPTPSVYPDITIGKIYVVFILQGTSELWCTTIDNVPLDTLVGSATWAILGWFDDSGVHDWQQY